MMDKELRGWIVDVLEQHRALLTIAVRQRAKFEGWLKFELALHAAACGATSVQVETASDSGSRSDLSFVYQGQRYDVELKTCNTNWRMKGVLDLTRPITKNIASVVVDAGKLRRCPGQGIVGFCLFPVGCGDGRWIEYLSRIGSALSVDLSEGDHSARVTISLEDDCQADVIISTFMVPKEAGVVIARGAGDLPG
jgi:hypothetical protein